MMGYINRLLEESVSCVLARGCRGLCPLILLSLVMFTARSSQAQTYPPLSAFASGFMPATQTEPAMPYRYFVPVGYDPAVKYPIVIFLHGLGEKGTDNNAQLTAGGNNANSAMIFVSSANPNNQSTHPCFWIAPQLNPTCSDWSGARLKIKSMIDSCVATYNIDTTRIYITGLSMGGFGVTDELLTYPSVYAAGAAACGQGTANNAVWATIPFWTFHGPGDGTVNPTTPTWGTDDYITSLRAAGGDPVYTRYGWYELDGITRIDHPYFWQAMYSANSPMVDWMFSQRRGQDPVTLTGPYVRISSPTTASNYSTSATSITFAGTAGDAGAQVSQIQWFNNSIGVSGNGSGTTNWTASNVPLQVGANVIRIQGTGYAYVYGTGSTTFSRTITVTCTSGGTPPAAPTALVGTSGNTQVNLAWTAPAGSVTSYNVYRAVTAGGEGTTAISTGITETTYTSTGLTNGTTYYYKVAAVNSNGTSPQSGEANATPQASTNPAPIGRTVSFMVQSNGKYVSADNYGNNPLIGSKAGAGQWEQFVVIDAGQGNIALQSVINGKYVCADMVLANPPKLIANRTSIGPWESFKWIVQGTNLVSLISQANGQYVSADFSLSDPPLLWANRTTAGYWETFQLTIW